MKIRLILALTTALFSQTAYSQQNDFCSSDDVSGDVSGYVVGFFNGVWNTPTGAAAGQLELEKIIGTTYNGEEIDYTVFYNNTGSEVDASPLQDVAEVFIQRAEEIDRDLLDNWQIFWSAVSGDADNYLDKVANIVSAGNIWEDLHVELRTESIGLISDLVSDPPTASDYLDHEAQIETYTRLGKKLLFVAHSQGNLFVNNAYNTAINESNYSQDNVGVVHIAPASETTNGPHILANLDFVINGLRIFGTVPPITVDIPILHLIKDFSGHKLVETYLDQSLDTYSSVQSHMNDVIASLQTPNILPSAAKMALVPGVHDPFNNYLSTRTRTESGLYYFEGILTGTDFGGLGPVYGLYDRNRPIFDHAPWWGFFGDDSQTLVSASVSGGGAVQVNGSNILDNNHLGFNVGIDFDIGDVIGFLVDIQEDGGGSVKVYRNGQPETSILIGEIKLTPGVEYVPAATELEIDGFFTRQMYVYQNEIDLQYLPHGATPWGDCLNQHSEPEPRPTSLELQEAAFSEVIAQPDIPTDVPTDEPTDDSNPFIDISGYWVSNNENGVVSYREFTSIGQSIRWEFKDAAEVYGISPENLPYILSFSDQDLISVGWTQDIINLVRTGQGCSIPINGNPLVELGEGVFLDYVASTDAFEDVSIFRDGDNLVYMGDILPPYTGKTEICPNSIL